MRRRLVSNVSNSTGFFKEIMSGIPKSPFNRPKPIDIFWLLLRRSQCLKWTKPKSRFKTANHCRSFRHFESVNLKRRSASMAISFGILGQGRMIRFRNHNGSLNETGNRLKAGSDHSIQFEILSRCGRKKRSDNRLCRL